MQMIDLATAKAAKATDRRALALLAYDNASADPAAANWHAVADLLRLAIPATKAKAADTVTDSRFTPWADYSIPQSATGKRLGKSPVVVVTFADGETVRAPAVSLPGKPVNIGRGLRIAMTFYRARIAARHAKAFARYSDIVAVPELVSVVAETTGHEYDSAECNARTAGTRSGSFDWQAVIADADARGLPESSDDGSLTRAEFIKCTYQLAELPLREAAETDRDPRTFVAMREFARLRLSGLSELQIRALRWEEAEREIAASNPPDAPAPDTAPAPVAPAFRPAREFLRSTGMTRLYVVPKAPVAPACVIRLPGAA